MPWFRISFAEKTFLRILGNHGWTLESITVEQGVEAMIEFYRDHRAQHTDLTADGDMLLVQWSSGILDITRQLTRSGNPDNPIRQLSLSFQVDAALPPAAELWFADPTAAVPMPAFFTGVPLATRLTYDEV